MKSLTNKVYMPLFVLALLLLASCGSMRNTEEDLRKDASDARNEIRQNHSNAAELLENSAGYAIFPNVGKGAYIIGGASGNGVVYQNNTIVGYADLKQVDVGLQAGGKSFVEVLIFENDAALENFKEGGYELGANASAVILDKGVSRDIDFQDGVAVITMPKGGAMAGVSVGGQRFSFQPRR
jgi:lipid-binding SYLF domain-containing protein